MRQKTFDFFYATGIWFINGRQGIKIGWGLALEWALGLNPPFRLCITSQGVDDTQPKGRQMGKHIVSTCQINPLILPRRPPASAFVFYRLTHMHFLNVLASVCKGFRFLG